MDYTRRKLIASTGFLIGFSGCTGKPKTGDTTSVEKDKSFSVETLRYSPNSTKGDILIKTQGENGELANSTVEYANYYEYYNNEKDTEWKNETEIVLDEGWQKLDKSVLKEIIPKEEPVTFKLTVGDKEVVLDKSYYMFAYEKDGEVQITDADVIREKARSEADKSWRDIEENFVTKTESNGEIKYKLVGHIPYAFIEPDDTHKYAYVHEDLSEVPFGINGGLKTFYPYVVTFSINEENKEDLQEVIESDTLTWKDFKKSVFVNVNIGSIKYYQRKTFDTFANQIKEYTEKYRNICGKENTDQLDLRILHGIFATQVEYKEELPVNNGKYSVIYPFQLFDIQVADCAAQSFFIMGVAHELGYDVSTLVYNRNGGAYHVEPMALIEDPDFDNPSTFYNRELVMDYSTGAHEHTTIHVGESVGETMTQSFERLWAVNYLEAN